MCWCFNNKKNDIQLYEFTAYAHEIHNMQVFVCQCVRMVSIFSAKIAIIKSYYYVGIYCIVSYMLAIGNDTRVRYEIDKIG